MNVGVHKLRLSAKCDLFHLFNYMFLSIIIARIVVLQGNISKTSVCSAPVFNSTPLVGEGISVSRHNCSDKNNADGDRGGGQLAQEQEIVPSKNPEYTIKIYTYMLTIL